MLLMANEFRNCSTIFQFSVHRPISAHLIGHKLNVLRKFDSKRHKSIKSYDTFRVWLPFKFQSLLLVVGLTIPEEIEVSHAPFNLRGSELGLCGPK